jgi:hypothetical protein
MFQDFNELLSLFNAHSVKYLIVGGYAVSFHAQPRATKDIDVLIQPDAANGKTVYAALAKFGAPMEGLAPEDFSQRGKFFRMGREPVAVDILTEIDGVDFDRAWENRVEGVIDPASGLKACFISRADLMAAKIAAGRPQDIADVEALRQGAERNSQPPSPEENPGDHNQ